MGLLDAIGYVGDSFDKLGGRAVRGALGGHARELLSPIPFSDRLGITDPNDIVSGRNLTDMAGLTTRGDSSLLSHIAGFGAEMALDPTNYLGLGLAKKIAKPGKFLGKSLDLGGDIGDIIPSIKPSPDSLALAHHPTSPKSAMKVQPWGGSVEQALADAATAYGPQYPGGHDKLRQILSGLPSGKADEILNDPAAHFIASEIPEGSSLLGHGAEGAAFSAPHGGVVRVGKAKPWLHKGITDEMGRADIPEMLQPVRSILTPGGGYRVEHLPKVQPIYRADQDSGLANGIGGAVSGVKANPADAAAKARAYKLVSLLRDSAADVSGSLASRVQKRKLDPWDIIDNRTNVSLTGEGNAIIHDPGAVWVHSPSDPNYLRDGIIAPPPMPSPFATLPYQGKLREIGGPQAVQSAILEGLGLGTSGQGVPVGKLRSPHSANDILGFRQELSDLASRYGVNAPTRPSTPRPPTPDPNAWLNALNGTDTFAFGPTGHASGSPFSSTRSGINVVKNAPGGKPGVAGKFSPETNTATVFAGAKNPRQMFRHEFGHALVDKAVKAGPAAISRLPAIWQPAAWAKYAGASKLGYYADEIAQRSTQHKGMANQIAGGLGFAADPNMAQRYAEHMEAGPLLKALMMTPPALNQNRGALALGALSSADLARVAAQLQGGNER